MPGACGVFPWQKWMAVVRHSNANESAQRISCPVYVIDITTFPLKLRQQKNVTRWFEFDAWFATLNAWFCSKPSVCCVRVSLMNLAPASPCFDGCMSQCSHRLENYFQLMNCRRRRLPSYVSPTDTPLLCITDAMRQRADHYFFFSIGFRRGCSERLIVT